MATTDKTSQAIYPETQQIYAQGNAFMAVTVDKLSAEVGQWRLIALLASVASIFMAIVVIVVSANSGITPVLIKYDSTTAVVEITEVTTQKISNIAVIDALSEHWINRFIVCSETYDKPDQNRLYNCVKTFATKEVFNQYAQRWDPGSANNWFDHYGKDRLSITVSSISKLPQDARDIKNHVDPRWLVKYEQHRLSGSAHSEIYRNTAVIGVRFDEIARNKQRIKDNPLNFRVTSYRSDRDITQG